MSTKCTVCEKRNIGSYASYGDGDTLYAQAVKMCVPCATEAGWENAHSDDNHDGTPGVHEGCWICYPDENNAQNLKARAVTGTSRAGIVLHVTPRAAGSTKANEAGSQFDESYEIKISAPTKRNGHVAKLTASSTVQVFSISWDATGHLLGGTVTENGKTRKVRNVAEALRLSK